MTAPTKPTADYVLVPREPTQEMIAAGAQHTSRLDDPGDRESDPDEFYRARGCAIASYADMLAAAPPVQSGHLTASTDKDRSGATLEDAYAEGRADEADGGEAVMRERERCAKLCEELACMVDDGAGMTGRLWQAARNIRSGQKPMGIYEGRTEPSAPRMEGAEDGAARVVRELVEARDNWDEAYTSGIGYEPARDRISAAWAAARALLSSMNGAASTPVPDSCHWPGCPHGADCVHAEHRNKP